ncbi:MAG: aminotransferase class I/II-fold pyridoxal phosphate-dependent enzyme [Acutalibacteraceae bacterium]|nr:aminotransferase class I/II-fold pyridoxal phosphate-dependent enzyme [Acutalibacteraceae bacterium]
MSNYYKMSKEELAAEFSAVRAEYEHLRSLHLSLDMSRGKPGFDNMDLSEKMFDLVGNDTGFKNISGIDCRNYGGLDGLAELKNLFASILELEPDQIIVGGNSSLNMMFDTIAQAMTHGMGGEPWGRQDGLKFLCPVPGYDRHFAITEYFGFELIPVPTTEEGPDMDVVEELVKDEKVKGIWCVPKYSNPEGITYSDNVVRRMAALKPAASDFRIFWDNAYVVHDLYDEGDKLLNIYTECVKAGNPDLPIIFTSTSKITFPGAGVAAEAASPNNVALLKGRMKYQTIGPDKLNQLRHARLLHNLDDVKEHMKKHAAILRPKFEAVLNEMDKQLAETGVAHWTKPKGGYFISLYVPEGCAKRVEQLCANAGMILTPAGATYPYGNDPKDSNLRIAPSYPSVEEIKTASVVLCTAVRYAVLEKLTANI